MSRLTGLLLILGMVCLGCTPPEGEVERPANTPATNETTPAPSLNETIPPSQPVAPVEETAEEPAPPMENTPAPTEEEAALPPSVEPVEPSKPAEAPAEEPAPPAEEPTPPAEEMKAEEAAAPAEAEAATEVDVEAAVQPTPAENVEGLLDAEGKSEPMPEAKEESKEEPKEKTEEESKDEPKTDAVKQVEPLESPQTSRPVEQTKMEKPAEAEKEAASPAPVTMKLSPDNTLIQFVGTHVGDKPDPRTGKFTKFQGEAKASGGKLASVVVEIETNSLETEIEKLTNHLKSPDFFDARQHPKASFKSTKIESGDADTVTITGDLTLLGKTKSISFPAKVTIEDEVNLTAEFPIDRTQFGMNYGTDNVHKNVDMTIKVGK